MNTSDVNTFSIPKYPFRIAQTKWLFNDITRNFNINQAHIFIVSPFISIPYDS